MSERPGFYRGAVPIRQMPDGYLVNALLRALADGKDADITDPLTAEVVKRGIVDRVLAEAQARERRM